MWVGFPASGRAPGRGRYERGDSNATRFRAQRARLLGATAIAHLEREPSVTRVTTLSGVGRNTFYECFDDFQHALRGVRLEAVRRVRRAIGVWAEGSAGVDRASELCRLWLQAIAEEPLSALVALEPQSGDMEPEVITPFREALMQLMPPGVACDDARLMHAGACAGSSARDVALGVLGTAPNSLLSAVTGPGPSNTVPATVIESLDRSVKSLLADKL